MFIARDTDHQSELTALEAAAASARSGFACMFSTSDEYEDALISARRAEGRYGSTFDWQPMLLAGCALILSGAMLVVVL